jgi:hypothetical protein
MKTNRISSLLKIINALLIALIILTNSCNNLPTEPELQPGRRDYLWTVDTLTPGGFYPTVRRIWGSSPKDVYVIGNGIPAERGMWHFDGKTWTPIAQETFINLYGLYGFSKNDIWISSVDSGKIWHYNGLSWTLNAKLQLDGYKIAIENLWGTSSHDLYAPALVEKKDYTRSFGAIYHYDGTAWKRITKVDYDGYLFINVRVEETTKQLIINAWSAHNDLEKLLMWDGNKFSEILSTLNGSSLINIDNRIYFSNGKLVYAFSSGVYTKWQDFNGTSFQRLLGGRNEKDVFAITHDGIGHYNGINFQNIYKIDFDISSATIFEKEIFIITHEGFNRKPVIILHGKLKE